MKKLTICALPALILAILLMGISTTIEAKPPDKGKPPDVIQRSNGYPSGPHDNLNAHGKDPLTFSCEEVLPGGKSIFIDEYGDSTIQYVTNKKSIVTDLIALDPCAECFGPDFDPAKVMLPYEAAGYYVFADLGGKPNNGEVTEPSSIMLFPNLVVQACNDTNPENPDFPTYTECPNDPLLALGLITTQNVYVATPQGFERFESGATKRKGWSRAVDITPLFKWSGWVCDASSVDLDGDGIIDSYVALDYDGDGLTDPGDGSIDNDDLVIWLDAEQLIGCTEYSNEWILNIADLVVTDQIVSNDGVKLLKMRFYPVATTWFESQQ
jgi:hypothetical protein